MFKKKKNWVASFTSRVQYCGYCRHSEHSMVVESTFSHMLLVVVFVQELVVCLLSLQ